MGISLGTILQIFTHPRDLAFCIFDENGKYGYFVMRGPEGEYRILISTKCLFATADEAVSSLITNLNEGCESAAAILDDPKDEMRFMINPDGLKVSEMDVLDAERRKQIETSLRTNGKAETWKLFANPTETQSA